MRGYFIRKQSAVGFTLIELSIVLVILGLLVGGAVVGKGLLRASELRSVTAEYQSLTIATKGFREKYSMLPGDIPNATDIWGTAGGTGYDSTCQTTASTDARTCNGNGDGKILNINNKPWESFRFWQHLSNAGLIGGIYNGTSPGFGAPVSTSSNSPTGKLSKSFWYVDSTVDGSGRAFALSWFPDQPYFNLSYKNALIYGSSNPSNPSYYAIFTPEEMWNIDTKLDDGKPGLGNVLVFAVAGLGNCTTAVSSADLTANYLLTSSSMSCAAIFNNAF